MNDVDYIQKEKKQGMQYTIVSHDAVTAKVRPILHKHGIVYYPRDMHVNQSGNRTEACFNVRFENIDDRSDFIDVATFGYGVDGQDKGPGKAMSYGVKYALLKVLGLETGDDPDTVQDSSADHEIPETPPPSVVRFLDGLRKAFADKADTSAYYKEHIRATPRDWLTYIKAEAETIAANANPSTINAG